MWTFIVIPLIYLYGADREICYPFLPHSLIIILLYDTESLNNIQRDKYINIPIYESYLCQIFSLTDCNAGAVDIDTPDIFRINCNFALINTTSRPITADSR